MNHILSIDQFHKIDIHDLMVRTYTFWNSNGNHCHSLGNRIMINLFYEASSRTFASFHAAMLRLGGHVIPIQDAANFSSAAKGETLQDTIRTMQCYGDLIVLRHPENFAARQAAEVASVPIINAGDGTNEHPTQALLDFFTILIERGWSPNEPIENFLTGIKVTLLGDLKHGRTVKSLAKLVRLFDGHINWVSPDEFAIEPEHFKIERDFQTNDLDEVIADTDVLYMVRAQLERIKKRVGHRVMFENEMFTVDDVSVDTMTEEDLVRIPHESLLTGWVKAKDCKLVLDQTYDLTPEHMARAMPSMVLMHPLPRVTEIPTSLDNDPRSAYFRQMRYGLFTRMAVLETALCSDN
jgi:aspartate carbamoyltransferase